MLLSGQGADEVLGGYRVHLAPTMANAFSAVPAPLRKLLSRNLLPWLQKHAPQIPGVPAGLVLAACRYLQRTCTASALRGSDQYLSLRSYLDNEGLQQLLSSEVKETLAGRNYSFRFQQHFERCFDLPFLNQMLYVDTKTFLPDLNLAYSDKLSMACSIERVFRFGHEIVAFPNLR